ncbi:MAG: hypothetical protein A2406_01005 [Candidatus Komeilibacteria bacterium RIFOXYC1_FULL_37_11]|uniref:Uncharacterized protein n=1 Tax=Candidatus Komeilibacteria bacterium RIFOXYC1_FULL_37_11 TaxID=1798555 RepID=A0A1G2BVX0_9BACT|nr:MAG: hypothetical protein A2406_01005 [Candidatus Komeilibacteria bacterium RIFOXYC1_FULL_37_11]OGY95108.1 MAG: hypothetical protein A2611_00130 [Candidatus Komeilibacteria bacterium RIFOXYD1_FULL_37_29]OGY96109.1 MAG: hypothetical protein A2543_02705 [Candidatus Komeilibacteria bacterium RIFOXYD2_FULL_37_8]
MWITVDNFFKIFNLEKIFIICYCLMVKIFNLIGKFKNVWLLREPINQILEKELRLTVFVLEWLPKTAKKF